MGSSGSRSSYLTTTTTSHGPSNASTSLTVVTVPDVVDWLGRVELVLEAGQQQTREITQKQIGIREKQATQLLAHQPPIVPWTIQQRLTTIQNERTAWITFSQAHVEFLSFGIEAMKTAIKDAAHVFLDRALVHLCTGIVYLKNVFIFTYSMRGKNREQLLTDTRTCLSEGATLLDKIAPTLTIRQIHQHSMIYWTMRASAFHLVEPILQRCKYTAAASSSDPTSMTIESAATNMNEIADVHDLYAGEFHRLASIPAHLIDYRILLQFIPLGLDPTLTAKPSGAPGSAPSILPSALASSYSAIELARQQAQQWYHPTTPLTEDEKKSHANVELMLQYPPWSPPQGNCFQRLWKLVFRSREDEVSESRERKNVLKQFLHWPSGHELTNMNHEHNPGEDRRRKELHTAFLIQLIQQWKSHSHQLKSTMIQSHTILIPDIVDIIGEYLDLDPDSTERERKHHRSGSLSCKRSLTPEREAPTNKQNECKSTTLAPCKENSSYMSK